MTNGLMELPRDPHTEALVVKANVGDMEPSRRKAPNKELPTLLLIVELLTPGVGPGTVCIQSFSSTDVVQEDAGGDL